MHALACLGVRCVWNRRMRLSVCLLIMDRGRVHALCMFGYGMCGIVTECISVFACLISDGHVVCSVIVSALE